MIPEFTPLEAMGIAFAVLLVALIICAFTMPKGVEQ